MIPRLQSRRPGETSEMFCHASGEPFPVVTWLKNDEQLRTDQPYKYEIIGNGTALKIHNITFSDTGTNANKLIQNFEFCFILKGSNTEFLIFRSL